jgi:D-amino-acid oxidase
VSIRGTKAAEWDENTWGPLEDLAANHPEAGVHFQGGFRSCWQIFLKADQGKECEIHSRTKDIGSATADWFAELLSPSPWFKDVVPNVSSSSSVKTSTINSDHILLSSAAFPRRLSTLT